MSEKHLETLMKAYLELAHVVPSSCKTHRELKLEAEKSRLEKERDLLRMAVVRFGDHSKMATVEPMELQHVIDDAFEKGGKLTDKVVNS